MSILPLSTIRKHRINYALIVLYLPRIVDGFHHISFLSILNITMDNTHELDESHNTTHEREKKKKNQLILIFYISNIQSFPTVKSIFIKLRTNSNLIRLTF